MDARALQQLRPRDESADAIAAAIERGNEVLLELRADFAAVQGARRGLLLSGTTADLERNESRARAVQVDIERIEVIIEELRPTLAVARGRERLAVVETKRAEAAAAVEAFRRFWSDEYELHALAIAHGLELGRAARAAAQELAGVASRAQADPDVAAAGGIAPNVLAPLPVAYVGNGSKSPEMLICLPAIRPGRAIAWPSGHWLAEIQRGTEATAYAR